MASSSANSYSEALATARRQSIADREVEQAAAVVASAAQGAFDSLRPSTKRASVDPRAARLLVESALRRLRRWSDPATGGLDAADRDGLLRQAEMMGVNRAAAERVLAGVEQAWIHRPRPAASPEAVEAPASRWRLSPRTTAIFLALAIAVATLAVIQVKLFGLWSDVLHGG